MLNHAQPDSLPKTAVFRLNGGDLFQLARDHYRLSPNPLSPFRGQPHGGGALSSEAAELAADPDLERIASVLAAPDLRLRFQKGGLAKTPEGFSAYCRHNGEGTEVVSLGQERGLVEATYFADLAHFCSYFATLHASPVMAPPPNVIKTEVPLEVMLIIMGLVDCYRRAYLNGMLNGETEPVEAIFEDEFLAVFEHELKSTDIRWLLPSFLRLTPGLAETPLNFSGEEMDQVRALGFITRAAGPAERAIYLFGPPLKYMGLEFTAFWNVALGFEVAGLEPTSGKVTALGRHFLAPTAEANHLITVRQTAGAGNQEGGVGSERRGTCIHHSLTWAQTAEELGKIIDKAAALISRNSLEQPG